MVRPYLSVVIPAYNEARRLPLTLIDIDRHLSKKGFSYDITVAVSPSEDNTLEILKRFELIIKNFKVIALKENQGRGLAVKTGMLAAKGNWRLEMDADNSTAIIEFDKMMPYVKDYDIVIGSRYILGAQIDPPLSAGRRLAAKIGSVLIRSFFIGNIRDPLCGFKCFSSAAADKLFSAAKSNGWALDTEILRRAQKQGLKIKEVPVFWSYDTGGHRTPHSFIKIAGEYFKILLN